MFFVVVEVLCDWYVCFQQYLIYPKYYFVIEKCLYKYDNVSGVISNSGLQPWSSEPSTGCFASSLRTRSEDHRITNYTFTQKLNCTKSKY